MKRRGFIVGAIAAAVTACVPWKPRPQWKSRLGIAQHCIGLEETRGQVIQECRVEGDSIVPTGRWFTIVNGGWEPGVRVWAIESGGEWEAVAVEC